MGQSSHVSQDYVIFCLIIYYYYYCLEQLLLLDFYSSFMMGEVNCLCVCV